MASPPIDLGMAAGEVLRRYPDTLEVFDHHGVVFCAGCFLTLFDPLGDVAGYHAVHDVAALLADLNHVAERPQGERPLWAQGSATAATPPAVRPIAAEAERRVATAMAGDALAASLGIRLVGVGEGSARAAVETPSAGVHPALAAALAAFAAQAADLALGHGPGQVTDLRLGPFDASAAGGAVVAEAHHALGGPDAAARTYHVRLSGRAERAIGLAQARIAGA
jgi:hypothetical protein